MERFSQFCEPRCIEIKELRRSSVPGQACGLSSGQSESIDRVRARIAFRAATVAFGRTAGLPYRPETDRLSIFLRPTKATAVDARENRLYNEWLSRSAAERTPERGDID